MTDRTVTVSLDLTENEAHVIRNAVAYQLQLLQYADGPDGGTADTLLAALPKLNLMAQQTWRLIHHPVQPDPTR